MGGTVNFIYLIYAQHIDQWSVCECACTWCVKKDKRLSIVTQKHSHEIKERNISSRVYYVCSVCITSLIDSFS